MLVKCLRTQPDDEQKKALGAYYEKYASKQDCHLTTGKDYLVLGLTMNTGIPRMALGILVTVLCDFGHIESYPIVLFEVLDGTVDPEWQVHVCRDGIVEVEPELMHTPHFEEDHSERVPEIRKAFDELFHRMNGRQGLSTKMKIQ